jgi:hypothetical protein
MQYFRLKINLHFLQSHSITLSRKSTGNISEYTREIQQRGACAIIQAEKPTL